MEEDVDNKRGSRTPGLGPRTPGLRQLWERLQFEERETWKYGGLPLNPPPDSPQNNPHSLLRSRKCCLNLAGGQATSSRIRLVEKQGSRLRRPTDFSENEEIATSFTNEVESTWREEDKELYIKALMCAQFPVLSAPDPPPDGSPSSSYYIPRPHSTTSGFSESLSWHSEGDGRDSEMEYSIIPPEMLCEWLRQAFGLSKERYRHYEKHLKEKHQHKAAAKILVEELVVQLSLLENNTNTFYSPKLFLSPHGYETWQQHKRWHLGELCSKFWHFSLPTVKTSHPALQPGHTEYHKLYKLLLYKLLSFEKTCNQKEKTHRREGFSSLLSASSQRLLVEFSLRYGIGDMYRRLVYLEFLAENFRCESWFILHTVVVARIIVSLLPQNRLRAVMVHLEYEKLCGVVIILLRHCENYLTRIKRLFTRDTCQQGIASLIGLLELTMKLQCYLKDKPQTSITQKLQTYAKKNINTSYERYKIIAFSDLRMDADSVEMSPKLLYRLMNNVRDEVKDYQENYASAFSAYFDVTREACIELYQLLMRDVQLLCTITQQKQSHSELDLSMVGLAYRLNQLDTDWANFIHPRLQIWRGLFEVKLRYWLVVINKHCQQLIKQAVGVDQYEVLLVAGLPPHDMESPPRASSTLSATSFSPSLTSAFSAVNSLSSHINQLNQNGRTSLAGDLHSAEQNHDKNLTSGKPYIRCKDETLQFGVNSNRYTYLSKSTDYDLNMTLDLSWGDTGKVAFIKENTVYYNARSFARGDTVSLPGDTGQMLIDPTLAAAAGKRRLDAGDDSYVETGIDEDYDEECGDGDQPRYKSAGYLTDSGLSQGGESYTEADVSYMGGGDCERPEIYVPANMTRNNTDKALSESVSGVNVENNMTVDETGDTLSKQSNIDVKINAVNSSSTVNSSVTEQQQLKDDQDDVKNNVTLANITTKSTEPQAHGGNKEDVQSKKEQQCHDENTTDVKSNTVQDNSNDDEVEESMLNDGKRSKKVESTKKLSEGKSIINDNYCTEQSEGIKPVAASKYGIEVDVSGDVTADIANTGSNITDTHDTVSNITDTDSDIDCDLKIDMIGKADKSVGGPSEGIKAEKQQGHSLLYFHGKGDNSADNVVKHSENQQGDNLSIKSWGSASSAFKRDLLNSGAFSDDSLHSAPSATSNMPSVSGSSHNRPSATNNMPSVSGSTHHVKYSHGPLKPGDSPVKIVLVPPTQAKNKPLEETVSHEPCGDDRDTDYMSSVDCPHILSFSGSVLDTVCLLMRLAGFAETMCDNIYPSGFCHTPGSIEYLTLCEDEGTDGHGSVQPAMKALRSNVMTDTLQILSGLINLYADNILCMDLCGIRETEADTLISEQLLAHIRRTHHDGLIWGCRHLINGKDCLKYTRSKARLLADKHEPVVQEMCVRVNNLHELLTIWTEIRRDVCGRLSGGEKTVSDTPHEKVETSGPLEPGDDCDGRGRQEVDDEDYSVDCASHLRRVIHAQVNILAYRINLFLREALQTMLSGELANYPLETRLKPIREFLSSHLTALRHWLNSPCYKSFLQSLWLMITQELKQTTLLLLKVKKGADDQALFLIQLIMSSMTLIHRAGHSHGITLGFLVSASEMVSTWLELFSWSTSRLAQLYIQLLLLETVGSAAPPSEILSRDTLRQMTSDLHSHRKCFSGHALIVWLRRHLKSHELAEAVQKLSGGSMSSRSSSQPLPVTGSRENATTISQHLLTTRVIADVDEGRVKPDKQRSDSSSSATSFPQLVFCGASSMSARRVHTMPVLRGDDDSTSHTSSESTSSHEPAKSLDERLLPQSAVFHSLSRGRQSSSSSDDTVIGAESHKAENKQDTKNLPQATRFEGPLQHHVPPYSSPYNAHSEKPDTLTKSSTEHDNIRQSRHSLDSLNNCVCSGERGFSSSSSTSSALTNSHSSLVFENSASIYYRFVSIFTPFISESTASYELDEGGSIAHYASPPTSHPELTAATDMLYKMKVTPKFVARLLVSRCHKDMAAREFLRTIPLTKLEEYSIIFTDESASICHIG